MVGYLPNDLNRQDLVPIAFTGLLLISIVVSGFDYYIIKRASILFFYAVLVGIITSWDDGKYRESHIEFLTLAVSSVIIGYWIEQVIVEFSGGMHAIQAVALALLISRFYINSLHGAMFRWDDPVDRYVIYIPSAVALLLPVLIFQVEINPIFGYDPDSLLMPSRDSFFALGYLSIVAATAVYVRIEKGWRLSR